MITFLDLETRKCRLKKPYSPPPQTNSDRRPVTLRWQVFMLGVMTLEDTEVTLFEGAEEDIFTDAYRWLNLQHTSTIVYEGTRSFDENICKGTFINARRRALFDPGPWPRLVGADTFVWRNLGPKPYSNPDGLGKTAPIVYLSDPEKIRQHCRWDVLSMKDRWVRMHEPNQ